MINWRITYDQPMINWLSIIDKLLFNSWSADIKDMAACLFVFSSSFLLQIHMSGDSMGNSWSTDDQQLFVLFFFNLYRNDNYIIKSRWLIDHQQMINWWLTDGQLLINWWLTNSQNLINWLLTGKKLMINSWSIDNQLIINWWSTVEQLRINIRSTDEQHQVNSRYKRYDCLFCLCKYTGIMTTWSTAEQLIINWWSTDDQLKIN